MTSEKEPIEAILSAPHLTDVLSRVRIDITAALEGEHAAALAAAARQCEHCTSIEECRAWIAAHEEGEGHEPPEFCPTAALMRSMKPTKAAAAGG